MAKTAEEKAVDDVVKAHVALAKAEEKAKTARERAAVADNDERRAQRVLNWAASHPDLPEEFELEAYLAAQEPIGTIDDEPVADVPSTETDGSVSDTDETINHPEGEGLTEDLVDPEPVKPAPKAKAKVAAKPKPAATLEPVAEDEKPVPTVNVADDPFADDAPKADDDDPFGGE